jgi:hypothetical protein
VGFEVKLPARVRREEENEGMICEACRDRRHGDCRGGTWCDCQHKPPEDAAAEPDDGAEPEVNWLRQG